MKVVSGRDFARIVERRGWRLLRVAGSHHIYGKQGSVVRLSIPIHGNRPLKTGLLRHLAKLAEVEDELA
jgi:predicted RNA binding protein YcfA (HicA-like mRNA interferase family)